MEMNQPFAPSRDQHLAWSRVHAEAGRVDDAWAELRASLDLDADYAFLARAARHFARLKHAAAPSVIRTARIAVVSSTTTDLFTPLLELACFRDQIGVEIYHGLFGNYQQAVLDGASDLYAFRPDFVLVLTNWRDANLAPFSADPDGETSRVVSEVCSLWHQLLGRLTCRVIQHAFDLPADDPNGHVGFAHPGGRARVLRAINDRLRESAPPEVAVLDLDHIAGLCGKRRWFDRTYWHTIKQYPAPAALPTLVDHHVALIRAALGLTRKVLALDLDNTLWGGIVGEDGVDNLRIGPPSAAGEAHVALQVYAAELATRGIVLAACSKNNPTDALLPFTRRDGMVLRMEDFAAFRANWTDKPANLRDIARTLNLGLDSFVFLDDNPVERALVRAQCPGVAVPEVGEDPADFVRVLDKGLYFELWALSREDMNRARTYRGNAEREQLRTSAGSLDEFLRSLGMRAECGPFDDSVLARVVQLIGKTNQFNLTSRRHSEATVREMLRSPDCWTLYVKLTDRFGDNGLIGVMIARRALAGRRWLVDTWLMSCRVIGRRVEDLMLGRLWQHAASVGAVEIEGVYLPTAKNEMVAGLYSRYGFKVQPACSEEGMRYVVELSKATSPNCDVITVIER
jgi:FkbH-like protein